MSDFDFDELDKAVNGVLEDTDTPLPQTEAPKADERSQPVRSETPIAERPASMPAARRAGGRFMDVVHPSSDMRTPVASTTPPVNSESGRIPQPPAFQATPIKETPFEAPAPDWAKPLESPFLPDAKVEKRPLGGLVGENKAEAIPQTPQFSFEEPKDELLEAPDEPLLEETTMPDPIDFSPKLEAIEVEDVTVEEVAPEQPLAPEPLPESSIKPVAPEVLDGPIAITQQYKEQPVSEQASGAIYDTEAYHQPLAKPAKKRSGLWVVLWIFLLIALGAGTGAVVYLYVLPLL